MITIANPGRRRAVVGLVLASMVVTSGCSAQTSRARDTDTAFGARVRAYLMAHPEVIEEAAQALEAQRSAAASVAAAGAIRLRRTDLEHDPHDPVAGNAAGSVTVVEFFDYRCPYCKVAAPALPAFLAAHPKVRLVLKEFPILSEESEKAARLALAVDRQGKYWAVHQALMKLPTLSDAAVEATLREQGVDVARAKSDAAAPAIGAELKANHNLAGVLAVNGTPSFVVGSRIIQGWLPDDLDGAIKAVSDAPPR